MHETGQTKRFGAAWYFGLSDVVLIQTQNLTNRQLAERLLSEVQLLLKWSIMDPMARGRLAVEQLVVMSGGQK